MEDIGSNDKNVTQKNKGPHGLGDPYDKSLRKVELEVLIPKKMRDIANKEKCHQEVSDFSICCKESKFSMLWNCRSQNTVLHSCLERWYMNSEFKERCKLEYLDERSEYRRTGIKTSKRFPQKL